MHVKTAEPDLAEQVDIDSQLSCTLMWADSEKPACDEPAAWANRLACCGYVKVVCEAHHRLIDQMEEFVCRRCGARNPKVAMAWRV